MNEIILKYCLENASIKSVQKAVKSFNPKKIAYDLKLHICSEFNLNKGGEFGVAISNAFEPYKVNQIELVELNREIDNVRRWLKFQGRFHPEYTNKVIEHDALCLMNNTLNEPITQFLKDYKKAQKLKGKKISVKMKKQPNFYNPF